jgi:hypothetical protein
MAEKPKRSPKSKDDPEQSKRFEDMARELEADESGETFQRAIRSVTNVPRATPPQEKKKSSDQQD